MRLTFNNCSAHQVQWFPFHFLEPPAVGLREILSFLTHSFQSVLFQINFELLHPQMTLLNKTALRKMFAFLMHILVQFLSGLILSTVYIYC